MGLPTRLKTFLALLLAVIICLIVIGALSQLDFHVILFVRSLHHPILERIGNVGNRLGHGLTLTLLCGGLFAVGYVWKKNSLRCTGIDGVIAQALVGLTTQAPKHLIGRPRPRFTHQDPFQFGPSFQSGLDGFPSGHAAGGFAMAAVLARYFPRGAWLWYGAALFVASSRVVRGSHFPTDVLVGAVLGYLVGHVWAHPLRDYALNLLPMDWSKYLAGHVWARPLREWRTTFVRAVPESLPLLVGSFALVWIVFHRPLGGGLEMGLAWAGWLTLLLGIGMRLRLHWEKWEKQSHIRFLEANLLIGLGLALHTHSLLVVGLVLLTGIAWWLLHKDTRTGSETRGLAWEALLGIGVVGLSLAIHQLQGLIPLH